MTLSTALAGTVPVRRRTPSVRATCRAARFRGRIGGIDLEDLFAGIGRQRDVALRGLGLVVDLRQTLDRVESTLAAEAYAGGARWAEIGAQLGISRQAAFMRHRARVNQTDGDSPRPFA